MPPHVNNSISWRGGLVLQDADFRTPSPPLRTIRPLSPVQAAVRSQTVDHRRKTTKRRLEDTQEVLRKRTKPRAKNGQRNTIDAQRRTALDSYPPPTKSTGPSNPHNPSTVLEFFATLATSPSLSAPPLYNTSLQHNSEQDVRWQTAGMDTKYTVTAREGGYKHANSVEHSAKRLNSNATQDWSTNFYNHSSGVTYSGHYHTAPFPSNSIAQSTPSTQAQSIAYDAEFSTEHITMIDEAELLLGFALSSTASMHPVAQQPILQAPEHVQPDAKVHLHDFEDIAMGEASDNRAEENNKAISIGEDGLPGTDVGNEKGELDKSFLVSDTFDEAELSLTKDEPPCGSLGQNTETNVLELQPEAIDAPPNKYTEPPEEDITSITNPKSDAVQMEKEVEASTFEVYNALGPSTMSEIAPREVSSIEDEIPTPDIQPTVNESKAQSEAVETSITTPIPILEQVKTLPSRLLAPEENHFPQPAPTIAVNDGIIVEELISSKDSIQPPSTPIVPESKVANLTNIDVCAYCHETQYTSNSNHVLWIACTGCKAWFHGMCAGFDTERNIKDVDKFYCKSCEPRFGGTTFVRKSARAHASMNYADLNEGKISTADDVPDHHYITPIKEGKIQFQQESFPRMRPELVTATYFERMASMTEPVVIPAWMNPRPAISGALVEPFAAASTAGSPESADVDQTQFFNSDFEYDCVPDDGQDKLDMVIPQGLTVPRVAELYGRDERVEVIDVKSQDSGGSKKWTMGDWAEYYEQEGAKPIHNVISLEVSDSKLGKLIRRPKVVRDLDLQDAVWPRDELAKGNFPKVQFYCLMSVADCYTDFHIDFGGSSVYYHILKGKKTFFFIPPKPKYLKQYEAWCLDPHQSSTWLGGETKECYRVDLSEGDTMLIPSGWIHAVWTPEKSLVIGGNFLTRMHYGMQIQINEIEKSTNVHRKFRYPHLQKIFWYAVIQYLEQDPVPSTIVEILCRGQPYPRAKPAYYEFEPTKVDAVIESELFNARYYSQCELDGLKDLLQYILRTVMISLGKIQAVTKATQDAVVKSIPKGFGDPLDLVRTFAMWVAWKRGNEVLSNWAYPDGDLADTSMANERKPSVSAMKRKDRQAAREAFLVGKDRRSSRHTEKDVLSNENTPIAKTEAEVAEFPDKSGGDDLAKAGLAGPKRLSCDACRKRKIRCKHHKGAEAVYEILPRFGIKQIGLPKTEIPFADGSTPALVNPASGIILKEEGMTITAPLVIESSQVSTFAGVVINNKHDVPKSLLPSPPKVAQLSNVVPLSPKIPVGFVEDSLSASGKKSRTKACLECRKSKRRCVHDEKGRIDPIKAQEQPVARGPSSAKRSRSENDGSNSIRKKMRSLSSANIPVETTQGLDYILGTELVDGINISLPMPLESREALYDPTYPPYEGSPDPLHGSLNSVTSIHSWNGMNSGQHSELLSSRVPAGNVLYSPENTGLRESDLAMDNEDATTIAIDPSLEAQGSDVVLPLINERPGAVENLSSTVGGLPEDNPTQAPRIVSRTPSLRIHTNGTESTIESKSDQSSPLTEIASTPPSHDFPHLNDETEVAVKSESPQATRRTPRQRNQVARYSETTFEKPKDRPRGPSMPVSSKKSSARTTPASGRRDSQIADAELTRRAHTYSPSLKDSLQFRTASSTEEVEDESVKLVRELTEQEFGLRRRSK